MKTYKSIDGVELGLTDSVWIAAVDMDSFNYTPKEVNLGDLMKQSPGNLFWSNYEDCLNECEDANSL